MINDKYGTKGAENKYCPIIVIVWLKKRAPTDPQQIYAVRLKSLRNLFWRRYITKKAKTNIIWLESNKILQKCLIYVKYLIYEIFTFLQKGIKVRKVSEVKYNI